jgi:hypothetical protein
MWASRLYGSLDGVHVHHVRIDMGESDSRRQRRTLTFSKGGPENWESAEGDEGVKCDEGYLPHWGGVWGGSMPVAVPGIFVWVGQP